MKTVKPLLIFDKVNARVLLEDDSINAFYTDTFNTDDEFCDDSVVEKVVELYNSGAELSDIDDYLLDEGECTQDAREIITEGLYHLYFK